MKIVFGTDEVTSVTDHLKAHVEAAGHDLEVVGEGDPWPDTGRRVGERVAEEGSAVGIVCCWTGTGVSMAANKVTGVRAALCTDAATADGARRWNDANVLALGLRLTSATLAEEIVEAFLAGEPDPAESLEIAKLR